MPSSRRLLVCDLDGTLLGDQEALRLLLDLLRLPGAPTLAFATGRQAASAREVLDAWEVDGGEYLLAGVGTEAFRRNASGAWSPMDGWPPEVPGWDAERVRAVLAELPQLTPQAAGSPCKVSFVAPPQALAGVRSALHAARIAATVIHSHGDLLDVLPAGVDKGSAVAWLARRLRIPLAQTMTCGDTENDLAMLELPGPSVIVGGAVPDLVRRASDLPHALVLNEPYAAAVVAGLRLAGWLNAEGWAA